MSFCEHCGKPLSPQANFCGNCGQKITSKASGRKNPEPSDTSSVPTKGKQKRVSEKPTDEGIPAAATSTHSGMLFYPISSVLIFFTTAIPVYVLTHPGLLYYPSVAWPKYKHVGDVWPGVFILIVATTVFALLFRTKIRFLISAALSIAYIVGLYYFPINYFLFREDYSHAVNDESMAYSLLLIAFNAYVFVKTLIDWYQQRLSRK